jgi:hypothetical protein
LVAFLDAGTPPVYVGFGSMPMRASKDAARVAIEAIRAQGRRALLSHGWADLALIDDQDDCFAVGEVNHQALFGRVAAVVCTTAAQCPAGAHAISEPHPHNQDGQPMRERPAEHLDQPCRASRASSEQVADERTFQLCHQSAASGLFALVSGFALSPRVLSVWGRRLRATAEGSPR